MAQADQNVGNVTFPAFRTELNDNLGALFSQSSGNSEPTTKVAFQPWIDTSVSPPLWKIRNSANTAWITVGTLDATFASGGLTAIANGGTGATTAAAALAALLPSQTGNSGKALTTNGTAASWGTIGIQSGTAVTSASGTAIDFTGIPSWVKRVTVMFSGLSTSGTSSLLLQLGTSSGAESTGYTSTAYGQTNVVITSTAGFILNCSAVAAADARHGLLTIANITSNSWVAMGAVTPASGQLASCTGTKSTSATLDRVRITTVNGTDTFDAGNINILYE